MKLSPDQAAAVRILANVSARHKREAKLRDSHYFAGAADGCAGAARILAVKFDCQNFVKKYQK